MLVLLQASWTSALAFSLGAALPLLSGAFIQQWQVRIAAVVLVSALALCFFGALGAHLGGANRVKGAVRVFVGGSIAMAATYGIGAAFSAITGGPVTSV
jgi:VIT1/CCC1 family predicted Fe2+/Mn2+ transporter